MKTILSTILLASVSAMMLVACAGDVGLLGGGAPATNGGAGNTATAVGKTLIQSYARNQCSAELNQRQEWRLMALAVSAEKQAQWENQICGCVAEEAPNNVTVTEMVQAATNPNARTSIVATAVTKTVTSCLARWVK